MGPNPFLGVIFHWIGGFCSATNFIPFRRIKRWSWEVYWIIQGFAAWIIAPSLLASIFVPNAFGILRTAYATNPRNVILAFLFGILWGVGGITFGLAIRYLGIALGYAIALGLCAIGLAVLIYPLAATGVPFGILLAVATGLSWAAGTVYLKWAHIDADPMGVASWQLIVAFVVVVIFMLIFEGRPHFEHARTSGLFALFFTGIVGNGVAYGLWFAIVRRLPAVAASLGVLAVPVIGIVASFFMLGEVPTTADVIGFALIFAASACVLLSRPAPVEAQSQVT